MRYGEGGDQGLSPGVCELEEDTHCSGSRSGISSSEGGMATEGCVTCSVRTGSELDHHLSGLPSLRSAAVSDPMPRCCPQPGPSLSPRPQCPLSSVLSFHTQVFPVPLSSCGTFSPVVPSLPPCSFHCFWPWCPWVCGAH